MSAGNYSLYHIYATERIYVVIFLLENMMGFAGIVFVLYELFSDSTFPFSYVFDRKPS